MSEIIRILHECRVWILFLACLNAAQLDFHSIYLENHYNRGVRHFELKRFDVIVTYALNNEIT